MEKYTLKEVAELLLKNVGRFEGALHSHNNGAFEMGERNIAQIIYDFLNQKPTTEAEIGGEK